MYEGSNGYTGSSGFQGSFNEAGQVDQTALDTWKDAAGSSGLWVHTVYEQSGTGKDFIQLTNSNQMQIANNLGLYTDPRGYLQMRQDNGSRFLQLNGSEIFSGANKYHIHGVYSFDGGYADNKNLLWVREDGVSIIEIKNGIGNPADRRIINTTRWTGDSDSVSGLLNVATTNVLSTSSGDLTAPIIEQRTEIFGGLTDLVTSTATTSGSFPLNPVATNIIRIGRQSGLNTGIGRFSAFYMYGGASQYDNRRDIDSFVVNNLYGN